MAVPDLNKSNSASFGSLLGHSARLMRQLGADASALIFSRLADQGGHDPSGYPGMTCCTIGCGCVLVHAKTGVILWFEACA